MNKPTQIEREKAAGKQRLIVLLDKHELKKLKALAVELRSTMTALARGSIIDLLVKAKCLKRVK
jgi:hypothetical protein